MKKLLIILLSTNLVSNNILLNNNKLNDHIINKNIKSKGISNKNEQFMIDTMRMDTDSSAVGKKNTTIYNNYTGMVGNTPIEVDNPFNPSDSIKLYNAINTGNVKITLDGYFTVMTPGYDHDLRTLTGNVAFNSRSDSEIADSKINFHDTHTTRHFLATYTSTYDINIEAQFFGDGQLSNFLISGNSAYSINWWGKSEGQIITMNTITAIYFTW